jgi:cell division protein FtsB
MEQKNFQRFYKPYPVKKKSILPESNSKIYNSSDSLENRLNPPNPKTLEVEGGFIPGQARRDRAKILSKANSIDNHLIHSELSSSPTFSETPQNFYTKNILVEKKKDLTNQNSANFENSKVYQDLINRENRQNLNFNSALEEKLFSFFSKIKQVATSSFDRLVILFKSPKEMRPQVVGPVALNLLWGFILFSAIRLLFSDRGVVEYYSRMNVLKDHEFEMSRLKKENTHLNEEIYKLNHDVDFQQKIVREHLGLMAKDELLILFSSHQMDVE